MADGAGLHYRRKQLEQRITELGAALLATFECVTQM
jgi:hypothetical protein